MNLKGYRQLVTRELAVRFEPDLLPCIVRLNDFVVTTESAPKDGHFVVVRQ